VELWTDGRGVDYLCSLHLSYKEVVWRNGGKTPDFLKL